MPLHLDIITAVLDRFEGNTSRAYVPLVHGIPMDNSGVTIGRGVDLGQTPSQSLLQLGLPPALVARLAPYCGLRRGAALQALQTQPLELSREETDLLNERILQDHLERVAEAFDAGLRNGGCTSPPFTERPAQVQAVTASLAYQYGLRGFPRTLAMLREGDYQAAAAELSDPQRWNGKYTSRRRAEAALLHQALEQV